MKNEGRASTRHAVAAFQRKQLGRRHPELRLGQRLEADVDEGCARERLLACHEELRQPLIRYAVEDVELGFEQQRGCGDAETTGSHQHAQLSL